MKDETVIRTMLIMIYLGGICVFNLYPNQLMQIACFIMASIWGLAWHILDYWYKHKDEKYEEYKPYYKEKEEEDYVPKYDVGQSLIINGREAIIEENDSMDHFDKSKKKNDPDYFERAYRIYYTDEIQLNTPRYCISHKELDKIPFRPITDEDLENIRKKTQQ